MESNSLATLAERANVSEDAVRMHFERTHQYRNLQFESTIPAPPTPKARLKDASRYRPHLSSSTPSLRRDDQYSGRTLSPHEIEENRREGTRLQSAAERMSSAKGIDELTDAHKALIRSKLDADAPSHCVAGILGIPPRVAAPYIASLRAAQT